MAVLVEGLRKRFRDKIALDGFDLHVPSGTVCGLLGPNGAGKKTSVRILSTLLHCAGGRAEVATDAPGSVTEPSVARNTPTQPSTPAGCPQETTVSVPGVPASPAAYAPR